MHHRPGLYFPTQPTSASRPAPIPSSYAFLSSAGMTLTCESYYLFLSCLPIPGPAPKSNTTDGGSPPCSLPAQPNWSAPTRSASPGRWLITTVACSDSNGVVRLPPTSHRSVPSCSRSVARLDVKSGRSGGLPAVSERSSPPSSVGLVCSLVNELATCLWTPRRRRPSAPRSDNATRATWTRQMG